MNSLHNWLTVEFRTQDILKQQIVFIWQTILFLTWHLVFTKCILSQNYNSLIQKFEPLFKINKTWK